MGTIVAFAQLLVTVTTLVLVRHQVSVAVRQIEQSEISRLSLRRSDDAIQAMLRVVIEQAAEGQGARGAIWRTSVRGAAMRQVRRNWRVRSPETRPSP